jgi:hypothetical protein
MGKPTFKPNPRSRQVWEDLDRYLEFCCAFMRSSSSANWKPAKSPETCGHKTLIGDHADA